MTQGMQGDRQDHVDIGMEPPGSDPLAEQASQNARDRELPAVLERVHEMIHRVGVLEWREAGA